MKNFRRPLFVLLALALVISLALNLSLARRVRSYYAQWQYALLHPLGLAAYPTGDAAASESQQAEGPLLVLFGDSRVAQWPASALDAELAGWRVINRGLGGQTSEAVRARLAAHVLPLEPDVIVLQAGVNDLRMIPLFPAEERAIIERCRDNLVATVRAARASGATVVVATIVPLGPTPLRARRWQAVRNAIDEVNASLLALAGDGVVVVETGPLLGDSAAVDPAYAQDWLHLNERGYGVLNHEVVKEVKSFFVD